LTNYLVAAVGALALATTPALGQNIVVDPGFETVQPPVGSYTIYPTGATFGGWTVVGDVGATNSGLTLNTAYAEPGVTFAAHSGTTSVDLTAAGNTSLSNGIFQDLVTAIGQTYDVSFWLGNATGNGTGNSSVYTLASSITLTIGGGLGELFTNSATTIGGVNWQRYTTSFVAGSTSTRLLFTNSTPSGDNFAGLDDVAVSAAPEAATWIMMIFGFGLAGVALRSRVHRREHA
jgi:Protein of unknown function (DUF642)/PEP-CTERM motif